MQLLFPGKTDSATFSLTFQRDYVWADPLSMQFSACDPLYQVHVHRLSPRNNQPNPQLTSPRRWDCTYPAYSSCSASFRMQTFIFNLGNFGSTSLTFGPSARNKHKSIMLGMRIAPDGICKHSCLLFWRLAIWIFVLAGAMIIGDGASGRSRREKIDFQINPNSGWVKNSTQRARLRFTRSAFE